MSIAVKSLVVLEPEARVVVEAAGEAPYVFDFEGGPASQSLDEVQSARIARPDLRLNEITLPVGPSGHVSIRILRPRVAVGLLPVIIYLHGGGWVFGNSHTHDRLIRELAAGADAAVIFPDYSLSPQAQYPTAIEESFAVMNWISRRGRSLGLDGDRIAVAGDSTGGNMAAALTLMAKERSGPRIVAQLLFYPATDARFVTDSSSEFDEGYLLSRSAVEGFWDRYAPDTRDRDEITASPLRATRAELEGLPPALVITAEADVLRDEGEAYAHNLRAAGVEVTATRYGGMIHDFVMLNALRGTAAATAAIEQALTFLRRALHVENPADDSPVPMSERSRATSDPCPRLK